jgi:hypothetical protein
MSSESIAPSSRRSLLAAAAGGLIAFVAGAMTRPAPTRATDGDAVIVGTSRSATSTTSIYNDMNSNHVLGIASVFGKGVVGTSTTTTGIHGSSHSGYGVYGSSNSTAGTVGYSGASATGVLGYSGTGTLPAAPAKTGVYGHAVADASSRGVSGRADAGRGVYGQATSGSGVYGQASTGNGLYGVAATGYALRTSGRVRLEKSSGVATIASGTKSITVNPGLDVSTGSTVLATLQGSAGGMTTVHRVAINATANTFVIYLTANATSNVRVAWFLLS